MKIGQPKKLEKIVLKTKEFFSGLWETGRFPAIILCGYFAFLLGFSANEIIKSTKYDKVYRETLTKYGDLNQDKIITKQEEKEFNYEILKGKDIIYDSGWVFPQGVKYYNGKRVPTRVLTKWLKDYEPEEAK